MFGYIKVDKNKMQPGEFALYHAFFCGICISSKELIGFRARMLTNFDIAFFNVLFHSYLGVDVEIHDCHCITTPKKLRSIVKRDPLTDKIALSNVILSYLNLMDDVLDEKSVKKRLALLAVKKSYKKAAKLFPLMDEEITRHYRELTTLEAQNCGVFDKICHPFAHLSRVFAQVILGDKADGYILDLCYNLGKWVYLIDALDDLDKDFKRGSYNPFIACMGGFENGRQFVRDNLADLEFILYTTLNKIAENFNDLELTKYYCVLHNVLHIAIRDKTAEVFGKYTEKEGAFVEQSV